MPLHFNPLLLFIPSISSSVGRRCRHFLGWLAANDQSKQLFGGSGDEITTAIKNWAMRRLGLARRGNEHARLAHTNTRDELLLGRNE